MRSLSETQFWFVVAAVALTPMLIFWITDGIGWFLRRTLWPCPETEPQSGREPASNELVGSQSDAAGRGVDRSVCYIAEVSVTQRAGMNSLPTWAMWSIIAAAVLSPVLA